MYLLQPQTRKLWELDSAPNQTRADRHFQASCKVNNVSFFFLIFPTVLREGPHTTIISRETISLNCLVHFSKPRADSPSTQNVTKLLGPHRLLPLVSTSLNCKTFGILGIVCVSYLPMVPTPLYPRVFLS